MEDEIEYWTQIEGFEDYEISSFGRVFNRFDKDMVLSPTMQGDLTAGLVRAGRQYRRSVKVLVARAFVSGETNEFNTPIQLDGDKHNLMASNIVWRPRWLAWNYARQFSDPPSWYFTGPIYDMDTGVRYDTIFQAATTTGSLCSHIRESLYNERRVFPDGKRYTY